jgi:hypothetical protein
MTDLSLNHTQVVYSNAEEQVISTIMFIVFGLIPSMGQGSVIFTIMRTESLHDLHFYIILGACISDLLQVIFTGTINIYQFILNNFPMIPCSIMTVLKAGIFWGIIGHVGLIACERYVYFYRPLKYLH